MKYKSLESLNIYKISVKIGDESWKIFEKLNWHDKKIIGDQFIRSIDSIGANIAEGYGRFHNLDSSKFYYYARGSLLESKYWLTLLQKRRYLEIHKSTVLLESLDDLEVRLNNFINFTKNRCKKGG